MRSNFLCLMFSIVVTIGAVAQPSAVSPVGKYCQQNATDILQRFTAFLSIPNVATDSNNLRKNADHIATMMNKTGIENVRFLTGTTPGIPPVVYGEVKVAGATQTLIFYAHYDGQPVNPAQWANGLQPFTPVLYTDAIDNGGVKTMLPANNTFNSNWRIYGRGASDDKAGVFAILTAYEALKQSGKRPSVNIKFFFEGEEEGGSVHLNEVLEVNKALLQSDLWIICDGPVHQSGAKQIVFGVRGDTHVDLTVYGPKRPLHSGHYGNWAPNPALMLAKLLAGMKDENGRVTIKGFYDDVVPLSKSEKKALDEVPSVDEQMKQELGIHAVEITDLPLNEAINLPSLNINGMQSGNVGSMASNQIPTSATAVIDLRLVLGNDWQKQHQKVIEHIKAQGYTVLDHIPSDNERRQFAKIAKVLPAKDGYNAQRTSMDLPMVKKVIAAVQSTSVQKLVLQPTMGGSLPLYLFETLLGAKMVTVPIANHDNNQHAENENIKLGNFFAGIETMASLMQMR